MENHEREVLKFFKTIIKIIFFVGFLIGIGFSVVSYLVAGLFL